MATCTTPTSSWMFWSQTFLHNELLKLTWHQYKLPSFCRTVTVKLSFLLLSGLYFFNFKIYNAQPIVPTVFSLPQISCAWKLCRNIMFPLHQLIEMPCYLLSQLYIYLISLGALRVCSTGGAQARSSIESQFTLFARADTRFRCNQSVISSLLLCDHCSHAEGGARFEFNSLAWEVPRNHSSN